MPPSPESETIERGCDDPKSTKVCDEKVWLVAQELVSKLSEEEKEVAARTSYRYFFASEANSSNGTNVDARDEAAARMARRHLVAEKGDASKALEQIRRTIQYRQEMKLDQLRTCFQNDEDDRSDGIQHEIGSGRVFVRGYDKENRAILHNIARNKPEGKTGRGYVYLSLYTLEKALACTEQASGGSEEKIVVCSDFTHYERSHAAPLSMLKELISALNAYYPERLHRVYFVDAPLVFRALWSIIKHFADPVSREKVVFVTGPKQREAVLSEAFAPEQAMPYMLEDGQLQDPLDIERYFKVPFDKSYDEA